MTEPSIGHNKPDFTVTATEVTQEISSWMAGCPAILSEADARMAKVFIDRGVLCVKDLEDERTQKTQPLNNQIKTINDYYRGPRELLQRITEEVRHRLGRYLRAEEERKRRAAESARRLAEEAERLAREAEQREREALEEADSGVLGVDVAATTASADSAFADYEKAERQAAIAEKETQVRIGGGFRRAASLKTVEVLLIIDHIEAVKSLGLTEDISTAILKSARAYKRLRGTYPPGIKITTEQRV